MRSRRTSMARARIGSMDLQVERLQKVVEAPDLHRLDGGRDRPCPVMMMPTRLRVDLERFAEQLDAVHAGHHQVAEHQVEVLLFQRLEAACGRVGRADGLIALVGQRLAQGALQLDLVVHDEQSAARFVSAIVRPPSASPRSLGHSAAAAVSAEGVHVAAFLTGSTMRTVVPLPTSLWISMVPWCSWTTRRQMASPRPVPLPSSLVVKKGSMTLSRCSAGMPTPVSANSISTAGWPSSSVAGARAEGQRAALRHGVAGVGEQVQEDLPQLLPVGVDGRRVRGELLHDG